MNAENFARLRVLNTKNVCLLMTILNKKWTPEILTPSTTFYNLLVSFNLFAKAGMRHIREPRG